MAAGLSLAYLGFLAVVLFVMAFTKSLPIFYLAISIGIGLWIGSGFVRWSRGRGLIVRSS